MKKLTKLQRSRNAHVKLRNRAMNTVGKTAKIKEIYHNSVLNQQFTEHRILSKKERKGIFARISKLVLGK